MTRSQDRHPDDDTILALAHGLLAGPDREKVLDHVRECSQCESQLRACARTRETAMSDGPPSSLAAPASRSGAAGRPLNLRRMAVPLVAVAAALVVLIGLGLRTTSEDTPDKYWLTTDLEIAHTRGDESELPAGLPEALAAYERRDLETALAAFEGLDVSPAWTGLRDVYLTSVLVNSEQFEAAETVLARVQLESLPHDYQLAMSWYQSVLLAGTGRIPEAREEWTRLSEEEGPIGDLARARLQQLE